MADNLRKRKGNDLKNDKLKKIKSKEVETDDLINDGKAQHGINENVFNN